VASEIAPQSIAITAELRTHAGYEDLYRRHGSPIIVKTNKKVDPLQTITPATTKIL
jgi:hypothetical protein